MNTFFASNSLSFKKKVLIPLVAILIFTIAGGTALASNEALPGDILYPIKINVNEKIETLIASSGKAKAKIAAEHAIKRLDEAEKLAEKGRLDTNIQTELAASFEREAKQVDEEDSVESDGEVRASFAASLEVHHKLIGDIEGKSKEGDKGGRDMLKNIKEAIRQRLDLVVATSSPDTKIHEFSRKKAGEKTLGNASTTQTALIKGGEASTTEIKETTEVRKESEKEVVPSHPEEIKVSLPLIPKPVPSNIIPKIGL